MSAQRGMDALALCIQHEVDMQVHRTQHDHHLIPTSSQAAALAASNRLQDVMQVRAFRDASLLILTLRQAADRAHDSRQHELLSQLLHSITSISTSLSDATAAAAPPLHQHPPPVMDVSQRTCELEQEVAALKASLASQSLLTSLKNSIGCHNSSSPAHSSEANALPELQVRMRIVVKRDV